MHLLEIIGNKIKKTPKYFIKRDREIFTFFRETNNKKEEREEIVFLVKDINKKILAVIKKQNVKIEEISFKISPKTQHLIMINNESNNPLTEIKPIGVIYPFGYSFENKTRFPRRFFKSKTK